jgi:hypothetical protein
MIFISASPKFSFSSSLITKGENFFCFFFLNFLKLLFLCPIVLLPFLFNYAEFGCIESFLFSPNLTFSDESIISLLILSDYSSSTFFSPIIPNLFSIFSIYTFPFYDESLSSSGASENFKTKLFLLFIFYFCLLSNTVSYFT